MAKASMHNPHLEGDSFSWKAGPTGILLIHGFTATTAEVRLLANRLYLEGFSVAGPLLPGHGTTPAGLNRCRWQDWMAAVELAYAEMSRGYDNVYVGGESMGAVLACWLAACHPEVTGLLLYAPAISVPALQKAAQLSWIIPTVRKKIGKDTLPWKGYTVWPLRAARQFYNLQQIVTSRLAQIHQPTLIFQGRLDRTIHPDSGKAIFDHISTTVKELHWMEHSSHCILLDCELDEISTQTVRFIRETTIDAGQRIPGAPLTSNAR